MNTFPTKPPDLNLDEAYCYTAADKAYLASAEWQQELSLIKESARQFFSKERKQQLAERTWICSAIPGEIWKE
jgi:hypothetical protein